MAQRFRDELGLSDAEAYSLMQGFAIEAIRHQPGYFVASTLEAFGEIMVGEPINVRREGIPVGDADLERRARAALRQPVYPLDAPRAQALLSLYDPARLGALVPLLFALGTVVVAVRREQRWLLLPALATLALVGGSAALVGGELRYRFPQDPLIVLVISGAALPLLASALAMITRRRRDHDEAPARIASGT